MQALFARIAHERGRVDILVNNAAIIRDEMMGRTKFWEEPTQRYRHPRRGLAQQLRRHGARGTVDASAAQWSGRLLVVVGRGALRVRARIRSTQSGADKMAADMAVDFKDFGIASVSIWMGSLLTDRFARSSQLIPRSSDTFLIPPRPPN